MNNCSVEMSKKLGGVSIGNTFLIGDIEQCIGFNFTNLEYIWQTLLSYFANMCIALHLF